MIRNGSVLIHVCALFCMLCMQGSAATITWVGGSGDWNTVTNWSTGTLPGAGDDVVIDRPGNITVTHSSGAHVVKSIQSQEAFVLSGGSLAVSTTIRVDNIFTLSGGTLIGGTVLPATNGHPVISTSGTLDGVTVNADLDVGRSINASSITLTNGLVLNGTLYLGNPTNTWYGLANFNGTQVLDGIGTVRFGNHSIGYNALRVAFPNTALTIGPNIVVRGHTGFVGYAPPWSGPATVTVTNLGTVMADVGAGTIDIRGQLAFNGGTLHSANGGRIVVENLQNPVSGRVAANAGTLTLRGLWHNDGVINVTNSALNLAGIFASSNIGVLNRVGGTVTISGVLDNNNDILVLDASTGSWVLDGGTIRQSFVQTSGGAQLIVTVGTFDAVAFSGELDIGRTMNSGTLSVTNGLVLNGVAYVGNPTNQFYGVIHFQGTQVFDGPGTVIFGNHTLYNSLRQTIPGATLALGPELTIRGHSGYIGYNLAWGPPTAVTITNHATVSCDLPGGVIYLRGQSVLNHGFLQATNGGRIFVENLINATGASVLANNGTVTLEGSWNNYGAMNATNSTVNLGGVFTMNSVGEFNRSGGTVNLTGTLNAGGALLVLNANTGPWTVNGGTLRNCEIITANGVYLIVSSGVFDGVWVNGEVDVGRTISAGTLTVTNDLILYGTLHVGNPTNLWYGSVHFTGAQTLWGGGTVVFGNSESFNILRVALPGTSLTLGSAIKVRGHSGHIGYNAAWGPPANVTVTNRGTVSADLPGGAITLRGQTVINQGTLQATNGGRLVLDNLHNGSDATVLAIASTLTLAGAWNNGGVINATNSTVNLGGTFAFADLGMFNRSGGTVNVTGILDNGGDPITFDSLTGSWLLTGGVVRNAILNQTSDARLLPGSGTLDGVTINGELEVGRAVSGASINITNGLVLNGTAYIGNATNEWYAAMYFLGSQTISGDGDIVFGNNSYPANSLVTPTAATTLTFGPGITIRGHSGQIGHSTFWGGNTGRIINYGSIVSQVPGGRIFINAQSVTNFGIMQALNGGSLSVANLADAAGLSIAGSGTLTLSGVWRNTGDLAAADGATLALSGTWTNAGTIVITNSTFQLGGVNSQPGAVSMTGSQLNISGTFSSAALQAIAFANCNVRVNSGGVIENTGNTLAFNATTGTWLMNGGTIRGGTVVSSGNLPLLFGSGTLDGVTIDGELDIGRTISGARANVTNGLVLNGTAYIGNPTNEWYSAVYLFGSQTISGDGDIVFGNNSYPANSLVTPTAATTLIFGPGITIRGHSGQIGYSTWWGGDTGRIINYGSILSQVLGGRIFINAQSVTNFGIMQALNGGSLSVANLADAAGLSIAGSGTLTLSGVWRNTGELVAANGATLALSGTWTNTGTIVITNSTFQLGGVNSQLGAVSMSGSQLNISGMFTSAALQSIAFANCSVRVSSGGVVENIGNSLVFNSASGTWLMNGGTIRGGTVVSSGNLPLLFGLGTLDGVTIDGELDVGRTFSGAKADIINGLVLNGTAYIGNPTNEWYGAVYFFGSQTVSGDGDIVLGNNSYPANSLVTPTRATTLTFGPGITIRGHSGQIGHSTWWGGAPGTIINYGSILSQVPGGRIFINAQSATNFGIMQALNGGSLSVANLADAAGLSIAGSGTLTLSDVWKNTGDLVAADGATLALSGTWTNAGTILVTNSTFQLGGVNSQLGAVSMSGSQLNIIGQFSSAALQAISFVNTSVRVNPGGVVKNIGNTLTLNANTGSWLMNGGTIRDGVISSSSGAPIVFGAGALDGVTVNGELDVGRSTNTASVTVLNGLVLNGTAYIGNPTNQWYGLLLFIGSQTLSGNGTVIFGNNSFPANSLVTVTPNSVLTIGPGITVRGHSGYIGYSGWWGGAYAAIVNQGTIIAEQSSSVFRLLATWFTNQGNIEVRSGALLETSGSVTLPIAIDGPERLLVERGGTLRVAGRLQGSTSRPDLYSPHGRVFFTTPTTAVAPMLLEAMGRDLGNTAAGFYSNFAYGRIELAHNTYVRLVDESDNSTGTNAEAVYVDTLVVPAGSTLDLNGLNLYTVSLQTNGTVVGGSVTLASPYPPVITEHPQSVTVGRGGSAQFSVFALGAPPLAYRWFLNQTNPIAGGTNSTLVLTNVQPQNAGNITVVVTNIAGAVTSLVATLAVGPCATPFGVVGWWPMEGNVQDIASTNDPSATNGLSFVPGIVGGGLTVATGGYIEIPHTANLANERFTFAAWVRPDGIGPNDDLAGSVIIAKIRDGFFYYGLSWNSSGRFVFAIGPWNNTPASVILSPPTFQPGSFYHVAGVYDGTMFQLYVNGALQGQRDFLGTIDYSGSIPWIIAGSRAFAGYPRTWNGVIDEVAIFNRALSSNEIAAIYVAGSAGMCEAAGRPVIFVNGQITATNAVIVTNSALVTIQSSFAAAHIFFTLDGSDPNNGYFYSGPFMLDESAILRAVAYSSDYSTAAEGDPVTITVRRSPMITAHPQGQVAAAGSTVQFSVAANGAAPLGYEWSKDGVPVPGAGGSVLSLNSLQPADAGQYRVAIANAYGAVTSAPALLTVIVPPMIAVQPASRSVLPGTTNIFCVSASGDPPLRYQWRKNGVNIPAETNACLTNLNVQVADGGTYSVVVQNEIGAAISAPARLDVLLPLVPGGDMFQARVAVFGDNGCISGTNINATAEPGEPAHAGKTGGRSVWYSWRPAYNGVATIETAGSSFDTLLAVYTGSNVAQLVEVAADEDGAGFFNSRVAFNAVANTDYRIVVDGFARAQGTFALCWDLQPAAPPLPQIVTQPVSQTVRAGDPAALSVAATGALPPLTYQWFFNYAPIIGATNPLFEIAAVSPDNVGVYHVAVSSAAGSGVVSDAALLEIGPVAGFQSVDKLPDLLLPPPGSLRRSANASAIGGAITVNAGTIDAQVINNTGSATSPTEPLPCFVLGGASRWLALRPAQTATLRVDTIGSTIDTVLGVFIAPTPLEAIPLVCDDNGAPDRVRSLVRFTAQAGTTYYIQTDGKSGTNGIIFVNWGLGSEPASSQPLVRYVVRQGDNLMLTNHAQGVPPPSFRWFRDSAPVANATNRWLALTNIQPSGAGMYWAVASNFLGMATNVIAVVDVQTNAFAAAEQSFDSAATVWAVSGNATNSALQLSGGNPGRFLAIHLGAAGGHWRTVLPAEFLGNLFFCYGGLLAFDLLVPSGASAPGEDVILQGAGMTLVFDLPNQTASGWITYRLPLSDAVAWRKGSIAGPLATREEMLAVLGALTNVFIGNASGPGGGMAGLDNVALLAPTTPVLSVRREGPEWCIEWPVAVGSYRVEGATTFSVGGWTPLPPPTMVTNRLNCLRFTSEAPRQFFRLIRQSP